MMPHECGCSPHLPAGLPRPELDRILPHEEVGARYIACEQKLILDGRYFLFLLVNVVFIFLVASTYWQLVRDFANSPAKGIEKLAYALAAGKARWAGRL